jgi:hypothetical protein
MSKLKSRKERVGKQANWRERPPQRTHTNSLRLVETDLMSKSRYSKLKPIRCTIDVHAMKQQFQKSPCISVTTHIGHRYSLMWISYALKKNIFHFGYFGDTILTSPFTRHSCDMGQTPVPLLKKKKKKRS